MRHAVRSVEDKMIRVILPILKDGVPLRIVCLRDCFGLVMLNGWVPEKGHGVWVECLHWRWGNRGLMLR